MPNNAVMSQSLIVLIPIDDQTMSAIDFYEVTALFGTLLETNKRHYLLKLRLSSDAQLIHT